MRACSSTPPVFVRERPAEAVSTLEEALSTLLDRLRWERREGYTEPSEDCPELVQLQKCYVEKITGSLWLAPDLSGLGGRQQHDHRSDVRLEVLIGAESSDYLIVELDQELGRRR